MAKRVSEYRLRILAAMASGNPLRYATSLCRRAKVRCRWHCGGFGPVRSAAAKALLEARLVRFLPESSSEYHELFEITESGTAAVTEARTE